ncbi:Glycoside hydrolase, clan GH-D [Candidatus Sulfopaludibacter sp. SbA3]|nr:Glycoside hydrolase, clan GH-D [Candidatus Sulfopaludibacter sp. SbA3]
MKKAVLLLWMSLSFASFGAQSGFDANQNVWSLTNGVVEATFQLTADGHFVTQSIASLQSGDLWTAAPGQPSSLIHFQAGNDVFDAHRQYTLSDQYTQPINPSGVRQVIVLNDINGAATITVNIDIYDTQPVIRYSLRYRNLTTSPQYVTLTDMLPFAFADFGQHYTTLHVNQWSLTPVPENFEQSETVLELDGTPVEVLSGAHSRHCGWLAIRDSNSRGLFAGWEFDGQTKATVQQLGAQGYVQFSSQILELNHSVQPYNDFQTPDGFIGLFHGDFDEAGYRTQSFMEAVLAAPAPDPSMFPYVAWDSWAYTDQINETILKQNADIAAAMGVELFLVDLGWAQSIGNWYEDPAKFPHGLAAVSSYVHSLGMKFGLHFALSEADPASPVLQANPDWTSTENDNYHGASSLCLSNQPTQQWLIQQGLHLIDDYNVDWILQDGENMVKQCTKTTHTHDPNDSNYANAVQGINAVVSAIQKARPNVYWENCEDGGNMMTFNMVKHYVTSITNDASGDLPARQAAYGATFPFSPRYAERYMPAADGLTSYATHSYMFGGNWVIMNQLPSLTADQIGYLGLEIANYKQQRGKITGSKVFHILSPSAAGIDVIQSYNATLDTGVAVVTRAAGGAPEYVFRPLGLNPASRYTVTFDVSPAAYSLPGSQLMSAGVRVELPTPFSSEIVHIDSQ